MDYNFNVTKTKVECYKIRADKGGLWADITVDDNGNAGRIQIASDYGSWEHYWGSCGSGFKKFLAGLDIHYAAGKFGEGRWFDLDATVAQLKKDIDEYGDGEDEKARMLEELAEFEDCDEVNGFMHQAYNADTLHKCWDTGPNIITGVSPMFKRFWNEIWPVLLAEFKKEEQQ